MSIRNYRLKFTPKAEEDFEEIYGYIINTLFAVIIPRLFWNIIV